MNRIRYIVLNQPTGGKAILSLDDIGIITTAHDRDDSVTPPRFIPMDGKCMIRVKSLDADVLFDNSVEDVINAIGNLAHYVAVVDPEGEGDDR